MSLIFKTIQTEGIAVLSYLVGDDATGTAAIFDPCADVERYLTLAREQQLAITHIFETHIHADLISGARELQHRLAGKADIYLSAEGGAQYDFPHTAVKDGDRFEFGSAVIVAKHTPGHTPEHMSYLLHEEKHEDTPWGVLSGDSLFVNSAGRPDLLGDDQTEELARKQFHTLTDFYLALPDSVIVYPAHGHGSPCGADIGARLTSTIGYERKFNEYLQFSDADSFLKHALDSAPPVPTYYPRMKKVNAKGPEILENLPQIPALPVKEFRKAAQDKSHALIDTRHMLAFGGGHVQGALNIGASPMLSLWAGWLLDPEQPILLVVDSEADLPDVLAYFIRTGYNNFAGYLVGGMDAWDKAGCPLSRVGQMPVNELKEQAHELNIIDVRSPEEWSAGHIPEAEYHFLPTLEEECKQLDPETPTAVYCASGYRASIGCSILKRAGFSKVFNVPGSFSAWKSAGYPVKSGEKVPEVALR